MEGIANADYAYAERVCIDFEIKSLGEHDYLYFQSNTLLLADVFEKFLSAPGLAWQAAIEIT